MMIRADNSIFVDANILVYSTLASSPLNETARKAIEDREAAGIALWISRQILREYLSALTRPQTYTSPLPMSMLIADVQHFERRFRIAEDSAQVTQELLRLIAPIRIGGKRIHDANIVATMLTNGITHLLTHNTADFSSFSQRITVVPLT